MKTYNELYGKTQKKGIEIFGNELEFKEWLNSYIIAVNDKPINLMNSFFGLKLVYDELCRIEHGILS